MYHLYILECADKTLYTGITTDLERRLSEHKEGLGGHYTRAHGAQRFIYTETHPNRSSATKREMDIKKMSRLEKLALSKKR